MTKNQNKSQIKLLKKSLEEYRADFWVWRHNIIKWINFKIIHPLKIFISIVFSIASGKKLAIYIGWVGSRNLGDMILFESYKKMYPDVIYVYEPISARQYSLLSFLSKRNIKKLILVLGGGTLINQLPTFLTQVKKYLNICRYAFCVGTGVEDEKYWTNDPAFGREWIIELNKFNMIGVRGPFALCKLKDLHINNEVELVGDSALYLAKNTFEQKKKQKIIGINFTKIEPKNNIDYCELFNVMDKLVTLLIREGWNIVFVPVYPVDEKCMQDMIKTSMYKNNIRILKPYLDFHAVYKTLSECDVFLGEKLHAGIIAAMTRTPFILIEYQTKIKDFMESINFSEFTVTAQDIKSEKLFDKINELYANSDRYQKYLDEQIMYLKYKQKVFIGKIKEDLRGY